jgi:hypothetical protein
MKAHVNVRLTFDEAYSLWREGKTPTASYETLALAMSARKKIARAMRGRG